MALIEYSGEYERRQNRVHRVCTSLRDPGFGADNIRHMLANQLHRFAAQREMLAKHGFPAFHMNLSGANLSRLDLTKIDFTGANLAGANLSGTIVAGAVLDDADLEEANLTNAYAHNARFKRTDVTNTLLDDITISDTMLTQQVFDHGALCALGSLCHSAVVFAHDREPPRPRTISDDIIDLDPRARTRVSSQQRTGQNSIHTLPKQPGRTTETTSHQVGGPR